MFHIHRMQENQSKNNLQMDTKLFKISWVGLYLFCTDLFSVKTEAVKKKCVDAFDC